MKGNLDEFYQAEMLSVIKILWYATSMILSVTPISLK